MPSLLITTSRKTSNRVRSFTRDLCFVLGDCHRMTRGGMGQEEVLSRLRQIGGTAVFIVTLYKGNPGTITILDVIGNELASIIIESAALRREVDADNKSKLSGIESIQCQPDASTQTFRIAETLSQLLEIPITTSDEPNPSRKRGANRIVMWFQDLPKGRTLWTHFDAINMVEIGPRIRLRSIKAS